VAQYAASSVTAGNRTASSGEEDHVGGGGRGAAARREEGTISSLEGGEAPEFIDAGDRVVALLYQRGRIKGSANPIELKTGYVWTVRDGKGVHVQVYFSWEEALAEAAL
jgi:hypothetical protein